MHLLTLNSSVIILLLFFTASRALTVQEWYKKELGISERSKRVENRQLEMTSPTSIVTQLPRFETHRELFLDDDQVPYQLGYRHLNPWVEKIFNKYAGKVSDPGSNALDIGRHRYTPKPRPF